LLGIRKHLGASIDLWQGDLTQFVCDASYGSHAGSFGASVRDKGAVAAILVGYIRAAENLGVRHVAIDVQDLLKEGIPLALVAESAMVASRQFLETRESAAVKRMTFVLGDGVSYAAFQQALFLEYPEDLLKNT